MSNIFGRCSSRSSFATTAFVACSEEVSAPTAASLPTTAAWTCNRTIGIETRPMGAACVLRTCAKVSIWMVNQSAVCSGVDQVGSGFSISLAGYLHTGTIICGEVWVSYCCMSQTLVNLVLSARPLPSGFLSESEAKYYSLIYVAHYPANNLPTQPKKAEP